MLTSLSCMQLKMTESTRKEPFLAAEETGTILA